ncbi:MAG: glycosyltransferase family 4 protein [Candidatus Woesearchaeota archaeon]
MKKINFIIPSKILVYKGEYYTQRVFVLDELAKHFKVNFYCEIQKVSSLNKEKYVKCKNKINFINTKFPKIYNIFALNKLKKNLKSKIKSEPIFYYYGFGYYGFIFPLFFKKNKKFTWVRSLFISPPTKIKLDQENIFKIILRYLTYPFIKTFYNLYSKWITKDSIVFFTGPINFDKHNHLNKVEFVSSSPIPENFVISKKTKFSKKVVFIGKNSRQKGFDILLQTLNNIKNPPKLIVIGVDKLNKNQVKKYSKLNIDFKGKIYNREILFNIMKDCDFLIMPSIHEKQGKTQVEAQFAGVVPICSDTGGIYTTVKNYYNGLLFKENNSQELKNTLIKAYNDFETYKNIRQNCIEESKNMTIERQTKIMSEVIKNSTKLK